MSGTPLRQRARLAALALLPALAVAGSGCLGYPAEGAVATPPPPGEQAPSRLPQLLSQLQSGSAGIELFDATPQGQVLAAQDAQGKTDTTPAPTNTPLPNERTAGDRTPGPTNTLPPTSSPRTATPTPGGTETPTPSASASPSPAGSATPTATTSATTTPTATATPTPTPRTGPGSEADPKPGPLPTGP